MKYDVATFLLKRWLSTLYQGWATYGPQGTFKLETTCEKQMELSSFITNVLKRAKNFI